jgi:hypothetical protein
MNQRSSSKPKINSSSLIDPGIDDDGCDSSGTPASAINPPESRARQPSLGARSCEPAALNYRPPQVRGSTTPTDHGTTAPPTQLADRTISNDTTVSSLTHATYMASHPVPNYHLPAHEEYDDEDGRRTKYPGVTTTQQSTSAALFGEDRVPQPRHDLEAQKVALYRAHGLAAAARQPSTATRGGITTTTLTTAATTKTEDENDLEQGELQRAIQMSCMDAAAMFTARLSGVSEAQSRFSSITEATLLQVGIEDEENSRDLHATPAEATPVLSLEASASGPTKKEKEDENFLRATDNDRMDRHEVWALAGKQPSSASKLATIPSRNSYASSTSTTMTPAPLPDGGLQRQTPMNFSRAGAFAVQPGIAMQEQRKGVLTPHPPGFLESIRRGRHGLRSSSSRTGGQFRTSSRMSSKEVDSSSMMMMMSMDVPSASVRLASRCETTATTGVASTEANNTYKRGALRTKIILLVACGVFVLALAVGLGLGLRDNGDDDDGNSGGTEPPPKTPIPASLLARLGLLSTDPDNAFTNQFSPQSQALEWIFLDLTNSTTTGMIYGDDFSGGISLTDETIANLPARLETRYALACFYFATNGATWNNSFNFLSHGHHECAWNDNSNLSSSSNNLSTFGGVECNSNLEIFSLTFSE